MNMSEHCQISIATTSVLSNARNLSLVQRDVADVLARSPEGTQLYPPTIVNSASYPSSRKTSFNLLLLWEITLFSHPLSWSLDADSF